MSTQTIPPNDALLLETDPQGKFTGRIDWRWRVYFEGAVSGITFTSGLRSVRLATNISTLADGSLFRETDTGLIYMAVAGVWIYDSGEFTGTVAQINALALTAADAGVIANVTIYLHRLRWTGTAFQFTCCDSAELIDTPLAKTGTQWVLCDGSITDYLAVGAVLTTPAYTTKNLSGHYRKSVTAGADVTTAAIAPVFTGTPAVLTGSVTAPVFTGTPAVLTGSVAAPTFTGTPSVLTGTVASNSFTVVGTLDVTAAGVTASLTSFNGTVLAAGNNTVNTPNPTLTMNSYTPAGTNSAPALTMNSYTPAGTNSVPALTMDSYTPAGTVAATAEPAAYKVLTYFRR